VCFRDDELTTPAPLLLGVPPFFLTCELFSEGLSFLSLRAHNFESATRDPRSPVPSTPRELFFLERPVDRPPRPAVTIALFSAFFYFSGRSVVPPAKAPQLLPVGVYCTGLFSLLI